MDLWHRRSKQNITCLIFLFIKEICSFIQLSFIVQKYWNAFIFIIKMYWSSLSWELFFIHFFNKTHHSQVVDCICQDFTSLKQLVLHLHRSQRKVTVSVSSKDLHKWNLFWTIYGNTHRSKHISSKCRSKVCLCSWMGMMLSVSGFKYNVTYINVMQI